MFHGTFSWVLEPLLPLRIKFASAEHIVHSTALVPARTQENPCADAQGVLHLLGFHILTVARRNPAQIEALAHYLEGFNHPIHCMFDGELPHFLSYPSTKSKTHSQTAWTNARNTRWLAGACPTGLEVNISDHVLPKRIFLWEIWYAAHFNQRHD